MAKQTLEEISKNAPSLDSPDERGHRIRSLRESIDPNMTHFCKKHGIKPTTLNSWELGRHGGLTPKGALILVEVFKKAGIHQVTLEWLLHGKGFDPLKNNPVQFSANTSRNIVQELQFFHQLNLNAVDAIVQDDGLEPCFIKNDIVAGIRQFGDEIENIVESPCIVTLESGEVLIRKVAKGGKVGHYTLMCTNQKTTVNNSILRNIKLFSAARIIWLRRPD